MQCTYDDVSNKFGNSEEKNSFRNNYRQKNNNEQLFAPAHAAMSQENSKFSAVNTVTVPPACRSNWIARKRPYNFFEVLMRMHPEVHTIILFAYD